MAHLAWPRTWSVRFRLTIWYAATLAVAMAILTGTMSVFWERTLSAQLDDDLGTGLTALAERLDHEFAEGEEPAHAAASIVRKSPFRQLWLEILGPDGQVVAASSDAIRPRLSDGIDARNAPLLGEGFTLTDLDDPAIDEHGTRVGMVRVRNQLTGEVFTVFAGTGRGPVEHSLKALRRLALTLVPLLLALGALGGWLLARRALSPVAAMAEQARRMGADRFDERLEVANPGDEMGKLAATFNELLDRIAQNVARMRQFVADASHELRTPVAVIRSGAAVALTPPVTLGETVDALEVIGDQTARLCRLVDDMFVLARADAGDPGVLRSEVVSLREVVDKCLRDAQALGRERDVTVSLGTFPRGGVYCLGDSARLEQMLLNLLSNATRYTNVASAVRVDVRLTGQNADLLAEIVVTDNGPGIPPDLRDAIFERFFRVDGARSRDTGGSGLGLPIARWVAQAHGGTLTLSEAPGGGCAFTVRIPAETIPEHLNSSPRKAVDGSLVS